MKDNTPLKSLLPTIRAENIKYEPDQVADIINRLVEWYNESH